MNLVNVLHLLLVRLIFMYMVHPHANSLLEGSDQFLKKNDIIYSKMILRCPQSIFREWYQHG